MNVLVCERCERKYDAGGVAPGGRIACPYCGDVRVVTAGAGGTGVATATPIPDRAQAMGLPPDSGPEVNVITVRVSIMRAQPLRFFGNLIVLLASLVGAGVFFNKGNAIIGWLCLALAAASACVFVYWLYLTVGEKMQITNKRVIWVRGLFARDSMEVLHDRIQNIEIQQSFWNRIWSVGRIGISSAGESDFEIVVHNIPRPYRLREIIDAYRPM